MTLVDNTLIMQMRSLISKYDQWAPHRSFILIGVEEPFGTAGPDEDILYINQVLGDVYQASNGGVYRLVGNIKGPTGTQGITGPTGMTGPTGPRGPSHVHPHPLPCNEIRHDDCGRHYVHHNKDCEAPDGIILDHHSKCCEPSYDDCHCLDRNRSCVRPYILGDENALVITSQNDIPYSSHNNSHGGGNRPYELYPPNCGPPIPRIVCSEAVNITPQGLTQAILTLKATPQRVSSTIDVSFCGSFTDSCNNMTIKSNSSGKIVVTASTGNWSVSMTVDFVSGQSQWHGSFNRCLSLMPGFCNTVFITIGFQSCKNLTGITLQGPNDFVSARLIYDFIQ